MLTTRTAFRPPRERGAALIEALVAILLLSIGLLGMVGLQAAAVRYEQNSWARAAVAAGVSDLAERIRSNPGASTSAYSITRNYVDERAEIANNSGTFTPSPDCRSATCTPAQLAAFDIALWRQAMNQQIPGFAARITGGSTTAYEVTVAWFDRSFVNGAGDALESALTCNAAWSGVRRRNCCPTALEAPEGVRCVNFSVVP